MDEYRNLKYLSMNELRAILYEADIPYPSDAKREDLEKLIEANKLV